MKKITFLLFTMLAFCWQSNAQDTCATATPVTPGTIVGTTITDATGGADMTLTGTTDGENAAWFVYTATGDGTIDVSACGSGIDTDLGVGTGTCGALTDVIVQDDTAGCTSFSSEILGYAVVTGETYYIEWSDEWSAGPFDWTLAFTPAPLCTAAVIDSSTPVDDCANAQFSVDIVVSDAGDAGSVFDDGTNTYPVVVGTVTTGPYTVGDSVTIELTALDPACSSTVGTFDFTCPENQDNCATADAITPGAYTTTINQNTGGTIMGVGGDSAFFLYTPTEGGSIYVNSCFNGGDADTNLNIGTGPCEDLTSIAANDDSCDRGDGNAWASEITMDVTAGTTYTIEWDDRYASGGNEFTWSLAFTPTPLCTMAVIDLNASTFDDTNCNPDGTGTYTIDFAVTNAGDAGTVLSDGTNTYPLVVGTVTAGPYNSGDSFTFEVTGTDMACDFTVGTFSFDCPLPPPANDDCMDAIALTAGAVFEDNPELGTNKDATGSGELPAPLCDSYDPADPTGFGGDVWYSITVPSDGILTVETQGNPVGNGGDTGMAIYTGTCGALELFECNSDSSADGFYSLIEIENADNLADRPIYIRVWEFGGNALLTFQVSAYSASLGLEDETFSGFSYYPNPVKNTLTLNAQNNIEDVKMYNMLGQEVLRATPNALNSTVDMSKLSTGAYFVQVTIGNATKTVRVIKQ